MSDFNIQGEAEQRIVAALRQGRQEVLAKLYDAYAPVMMGVISRIVQDQETAEEVLKDTFVAIWTRIGVYDASKQRLLTWGLAIARGLALEAVKSERYTSFSKSGEKAAENGKGSEKDVVSQQENKAGADLCHLDSTEKRALELIYLKGYTCTEAAAHMNMTTGQLMELVKHAFVHLKAGKSA